MKVEYLAAFNLLIAVFFSKVAVSPTKWVQQLAGPVLLAFIIVNAIALGAGVAQ